MADDPSAVEHDDVKVGMQLDPPGETAGKYVLIEVKNAMGVYVPLKINEGPGGTQEYVLTSVVDHLLILPHEGNDKVDTSDVTAAAGYDFVENWTDFNHTEHPDSVTIFGGDGMDTIYGSEFGDCIKGGRWISEDDPTVMEPNRSDDTIYGGAGGDLLEGKAGNNLMYGETGADTIFGNGQSTAVNLDDTIYGGTQDDTIHGESGDDEIYGEDGNDVITGSSGDDEIHGNDGNDDIHGGFDHDRLYGDADNDTIIGADGDDFIYGRSGDDELDGEGGNDTYIFDGVDGMESTSVGDVIFDGQSIFTDTLDFSTAHGNAITLDLRDIAKQKVNNSLWLTLAVPSVFERVIGTNFNDDIWADDLSNDIRGGDGDDLIYGGGGVFDILDGGNGNDILLGEDGADSLIGEDGDDTLIGGAGDDTLSGGNGTDVGRGGAGNDTINPDVETQDADGDVIVLVAASDTGVSQTDRITNDTTPTFSVLAVPETYVHLYRADDAIGTNAEEKAGMEFNTRGLHEITASQIVDGDHWFTYTTSVGSGGTQSDDSIALDVTIDTGAPTVTEVKTFSDLTGGNNKSEYVVPAVATSAAQIHSVQLTGGLDTIEVQFSEDIDIPAGAIRVFDDVSRTDHAMMLDTTDPDRPSIDLTNTLKNNRLWLIVSSGGVTDAAGNPLDGFWNNPVNFADMTGNSTFPSGNGTSVDLKLKLSIQLGDTNDDGIVDITDLNNVRNDFGCTVACTGDTDWDGDTDITDLNNTRNFFGGNITDWTGPPTGGEMAMGGGGSASTGVLIVSAESTTGTAQPLIGEEALRLALRDLYFDTIAVGETNEYADLFGWSELGNAAWWNDLLGPGWRRNLG